MDNLLLLHKPKLKIPHSSRSLNPESRIQNHFLISELLHSPLPHLCAIKGDFKGVKLFPFSIQDFTFLNTENWDTFIIIYFFDPFNIYQENPLCVYPIYLRGHVW